MSAAKRSSSARLRAAAPVFAALGDETRLSLVAKLADGSALSIAQLSEGSKLTRQGVSKHLRVLEDAGLVRGRVSGRENLFVLEPRPFKDLQEYLVFVEQQWDHALGRLKSFVEDDT